jgi:tripartite-type tricarboxylate transporter receptor subunit TctC
MVKSDSPIQSLADLLAKARTKPGSISYGTPGRGSSPHLMGELLARGAKVELNHIPYKGTGPAIQDLLGGHVDSVVVSGFDSVPLEKAGRVRTIAVTGTQRYPLLPQTPTFREGGVATLDDLRVWFGLFAPTSTPRASVDRLAAEIDAVVSSPDFSRRASELGFVPVKATPDEVRQRVRSDVATLADMVKRTGVKPD